MAGFISNLDPSNFGATLADFETDTAPRSTIIGHANCVGWHEPEPYLGSAAITTTVVGSDTRIDTLEDLAGSVESLDGTTTRRPYLIADGLNGLSIARFKGDDTEATIGNRTQLVPSLIFDMSAAHSMVFVAKMTDTTSTGAVMGKFSNATSRSYTDVPAGGGEYRYRFGATQITGTIGIDWFIGINAYDGSQYIKMYVDGTRSTDVDAAAAGGTASAAAFKIGSLTSGTQFADMDVAAIGLFDVDLFNSSYATLLAAIKSYCASAYAVNAS
jgi:hypothetical protein